MSTDAEHENGHPMDAPSSAARGAGSGHSALQAAARDALKDHWGWLVGVGIAMIVLGTVAIARPGLASFGITLLIGWVILIGGIAQVVDAVRSHKRPGFLWHLLGGILYAFAGLVLVGYPLEGVVALTLFLAAFFLVEGVFKIAFSFKIRPAPQWGWGVLSGIVSFVLAIMILAQWPLSAVWVVGLLVGIGMLFNGWSLVMLGFAARPGRQATSTPQSA
jgi:uncharacterized membrane protein HdeD (DUF308 family)